MMYVPCRPTFEFFINTQTCSTPSLMGDITLPVFQMGKQKTGKVHPTSAAWLSRKGNVANTLPIEVLFCTRFMGLF